MPPTVPTDYRIAPSSDTPYPPGSRLEALYRVYGPDFAAQMAVHMETCQRCTLGLPWCDGEAVDPGREVAVA